MQVETAGMFDYNCHIYHIIKDDGKMTTCENMRAPYDHGSPLWAQLLKSFSKKKKPNRVRAALKLEALWFITCKCCCRVTCRHSLVSSAERMSVFCLVTANSISGGSCSPSPLHMPRIGSRIPRYHCKSEHFLLSTHHIHFVWSFISTVRPPSYVQCWEIPLAIVMKSSKHKLEVRQLI